MATMSLLPTRNMEAHQSKGAHGCGVMEAGMSKAGTVGMPAMILIRDKSITINHGIWLPTPSHLNHGLRHNNHLPSYLFQSHLHQQ